MSESKIPTVVGKNYLHKYSEYLALSVLLIVSFILRFVHLNYSHFQGDEVRALYNPTILLFDFLLQQKKGPIQFIVTYLMYFITPSYDEFLTRLPFAIVGFISVFVLYELVKELYGKKVAFLSAFLFSVNGFFVAFSRIVQYQAFTFFFFLLSIYCFIKLYKYDDKKYLLLGSFFSALSFLSHYDAMFTGFICSYFIIFWLIKTSKPHKYLNVLYASILFLVIVLSFYIPFILSPSFSSTTKSYLFMRYQGEFEKETSTLLTYKLYNPLYSLEFLVVFALIGIFFGKKKLIPFYLWFIPPFILLGLLTQVPGTHIYNYYIPLIIIASYGLVSLGTYLYKKLRYINYLYMVFVFISLSFLYYQSYVILIDHSREYPWESQKLFGRNLDPPDVKYHLSIFGFPYNRNIKEVGAFVKNQPYVFDIYTNERDHFVKYYAKPIPPMDPSEHKYKAYIYFYNPTSYKARRIKEIADKDPKQVFYKDGKPVAEVYLIEKVVQIPE